MKLNQLKLAMLIATGQALQAKEFELQVVNGAHGAGRVNFGNRNSGAAAAKRTARKIRNIRARSTK